MEEQLRTGTEEKPRTGPEEPVKSSWWKLQAVFFEPAAAFEEVNRRPNWLLPLVLIILVAVAGVSICLSQIDPGEFVRRQIENNPFADQIPSEQKEQAVRDTRANPTLFYVQSVAPIVIIFPIVTAIMAGILLLTVILAGQETTFKKVFSATLHASWPYNLVFWILTPLIFLLSTEPDSLDMQNAIASNLGLLVEYESQPYLWTIFAAIDILVVWEIFLLGLGLSKVTPRLTAGSGMILVTTLYVLWVLLKLGFTALF